MNDFVNNIRTAVDLLDVNDETNWTKADGKPSVEKVRELASDPSITRADIDSASPNVTRATKTDSGDPAVTTETTKEVTGDGSEELQQPETPETQTTDSEKQPSENAPEGSTADKTETVEEVVEEGGADQEPIRETDEYTSGMTVSDFVSRGLLMAILLRLPNPMRVMADKVMLDDMASFVNSYELHEERMVVVEMIKSISETKQNEIPSGQYKGRVQAAMDVVRGDLDHVRNGVAPADDQEAAAKRLAKLTGQGSAPEPGKGMPSALDDADEEQKAAHKRLYGDQ